MAEIIEKVGFETSQAVTALNNLDAALKGVNRRLTNFNKKASETTGASASKALDNVSKSAEKAKSSVVDAGKALAQTGKQGSAAVQKISIGFTGLAKALVAREAVQALNALKNTILESADAASEFELSVARISNIAEGPGSGIDQLTQSLGDLSVELGRPSTEVAAAAFEALQNDLGNTRETIELLRGSAQDLALVTGGTLTQSINALSSVLKSYDLDISQAANISDIFFAAIDKGRINLAELESSLGKITPLAARLDIDFQNVAAAMAAITQQGTSAAVANTQLRSIFQKLIRPTEELQAAFNKLGVNSFNELISRSGNLQVALEQIAKALNNDDQAIAKAFGRLRGQLGVFNLIANEGKIFKDTLDAVSDAAGSAAKAADNIRNTDAFAGQQAAEEFNKTLREIGESVLEARTAFTQLANSVLPEGKTIADVLGLILTGSLALGSGAAIGAWAAFGGAISATLAPLLAVGAALAPFIAAAAVGFGIGKLIDAAFTSTSEKLQQIAADLEETNSKVAESSEKALNESNQQIDQLLAQRGEAVDKYVAGLSSAFELETKVIRDAAARADTLLKASFNDFGKGIDDIFKRIESQVKNAQKNLKDAQGKLTDAKQNLEDFRFDKDGRNLTGAQKFNRELDRATQTGKDLAKELKLAKTDPNAAKEAERLADRLQDQAQSIRQKAEQEDNAFRKREGIAKADKLEEQALKAKVTLTENEVNVLNKKAAVTDSILNQNIAIKDELKLQYDILKDQLSILNEQGKIKTPAEQRSDLKGAEGTAAKARELEEEFTKGFLETFGEAGNLDKLGQAVNRGIAQADIDFSNITQQLKDKINEPEYKIFVDAEINTASISERVDAALNQAREAGGLNPPARQEAARKAAVDLLREQEKASNEYDAATKRLAAQSQATTTAIGTAVNASLSGNIEEVNAIGLRIQALQNQLQSPDLSQAAAGQIESQLVNLQNKVVGLFSTGEISGAASSALQEAIKSALTEVEITELKVDLKPQFNEAEITGLKNLIQGIKPDTVSFDSVETSIKNSATSASSAATSMGTLQSKTSSAVGPMLALAAAAERVARANAGAASRSAYHGGVQHLASGGRGHDKIPTMLADGEFVLSAKQTRNFFPQVQAMNAGQSPQYREGGGPITNIGDINVNVVGGSGSENPDVAGRQIANSLRRELRRNTSAL
jgi:TP901 family phage tail tape measure protein